MVKQWRQLATSTVHLAQELLAKVQCGDGSRSFAKEVRALKMSVVACHCKLTTINWEQSSKLILSQLHEKLPENSMSTINSHSASEANWKDEKLNKWVSHELTKTKKIVLKCHLLLFHATTTNHFYIRLLWHVTKSGFYMTTGDDQLSGWTKKMLQSTSRGQTCPLKTSWSQFGGLRPVWSTVAFWIPVKPLHLRSMLSKLMRYTQHCKAYSWHWSTEEAQFFSLTTLDLMSHKQHFTMFTWPLVNRLPFL